jgi:mitofusin
VYLGDCEKDSEESGPSALGIVSVGIGAVTMIGGQAVGVRAFVEGAVRIANVFSNEAARKWAAPVLGAFIIGATTYFVLELPSSVPRTIGRRSCCNNRGIGGGGDDDSSCSNPSWPLWLSGF